MTTFLTRSSARRPLVVIALWVVAAVAAGSLALDGEVLPGPKPFTDILDSATIAEFRLSGSAESVRANSLLRDRLRGQEPINEIVIIQSISETVDSPEFRTKVEGVHAELLSLGSETVTEAFHFYQTGDPSLVSSDRRATIIPLVLNGSLEDAVESVPSVLRAIENADGEGGFRVLMVGNASIAQDYNDLVESDLRWGERIGVPIALLILVALFGTVAAVLLPVLLSLICIIVTLGLVALIGQAFDLIFFVTLMVVMIGLAVGIDYSLLMVSRYRDELARGLDRDSAIERVGATAGRTVLFSGITVVIALCGLLIVPLPYFQSLGLGAILVVLVSMAANLTLLPAFLAVLGPKINSWPVPYLGRMRSRPSGSSEQGFWNLVTRGVTRAPVVSIIVVAAPMIAAGSFYFQINTGINGVDVFPEGTQTREAFFVMEEHFSFGTVNPIEIVIDGDSGNPAVQQASGKLQASLRADNRLLAPPATPEVSSSGDIILLKVYIDEPPRSLNAVAVVSDIRDRYVPSAFDGVAADVIVGGVTAAAADANSTISAYTPVVFAFVLGMSFLTLMIVFRSIVIPVKAVLMNLLSVGAAYGLMVLVFQKGVATELLGLQPAEVIDVWIPLFMFSVLFGLSMDYHVFLLSRIRERYDETGDNREAVAYGLQSTGGLITGAALIMVAVFGAFASGKTVINQQMGFGLAAAIFLDATLVRSVLLPATMEVLGKVNWYLPSWLGWLPDLSVESEEAQR